MRVKKTEEQPVYDYKPIDRYVVLNGGDNDLFPIKIDILNLLQRTYRQYNQPEPTDFPDFQYVDGYGLPPDEQVFTREEIPQSIINLEKQIRNELKKEKRITAIKIELSTINRFWEILEENPEKYKTEIEWLEEMWFYRLFGKFLFINGKVTYITGSYHWYLNWWHLDDVRPEYRHWDMLKYVFIKFCKLDTTTYKNVDPQTRKPIANEDGEYEMIDLGRRVCMGVNDAKSRRVGDTSGAQEDGAEEVTRMEEGHFGTQGRDEPHAKKIFQVQFVRPFEQLPVFWKPLWDSAQGVKPKENLLFDGDSSDFGLHSRVTHAMSANAENYNGDKLHYYHRDESGSTAGEDVNKGHQIVKHCLTLGDKINGFCIYTSTVDEIETGSAGENYMNLCMNSQSEIRDENGRTTSGMFNLFIPAKYRLEGFIDKFGFPVVDDPTPEQAKFIGKDYGSVQFIQNTVRELSRKKDWTNLAIFQRQYPLNYRDCFSPPGKNQYFQVEMMRNRIQMLNFTHRELLPERGNFVRSSGMESDVLWIPDPDNGRWYKSKDFRPEETNRRRKVGGVYYPEFMDRYVASADTFAQDRVAGRASMGGGAVRWRHDPIIDPTTKDSKLWQSGRLIITYSFRQDSVEQFCEDMLMMCVYVGAMCYPERNNDAVCKYFRSMSYDGYLLYDVDRLTGRRKAEAGYWLNEELRRKGFNLVRDEILKNGERCNHVEWLEDCCLIRGPEYLTDFDRFSAVMGTLIAEQNPFYNNLKRSKSSFVNTYDWVPQQTY